MMKKALISVLMAFGMTCNMPYAFSMHMPGLKRSFDNLESLKRSFDNLESNDLQSVLIAATGKVAKEEDLSITSTPRIIKKGDDLSMIFNERNKNDSLIYYHITKTSPDSESLVINFNGLIDNELKLKKSSKVIMLQGSGTVHFDYPKEEEIVAKLAIAISKALGAQSLEFKSRWVMSGYQNQELKKRDDLLRSLGFKYSDNNPDFLILDLSKDEFSVSDVD